MRAKYCLVNSSLTVLNSTGIRDSPLSISGVLSPNSNSSLSSSPEIPVVDGEILLKDRSSSKSHKKSFLVIFRNFLICLSTTLVNSLSVGSESNSNLLNLKIHVVSCFSDIFLFLRYFSSTISLYFRLSFSTEIASSVSYKLVSVFFCFIVSLILLTILKESEKSVPPL